MKNLKKRREEVGLTKEQLGEKLGITRQAISAYEIGSREPGRTIIKLLAEVLGCTADYLLEE